MLNLRVTQTRSSGEEPLQIEKTFGLVSEIDIIPNGEQLPRFLRSSETTVILNILRKLQPGDIVSYKSLSDAAAREIKGTSRALRSARRIMQKNYSVIIDCIPGFGVKRLKSEEIVRKASKGASLIAKKAQIEGDKLSLADFGSLNSDERRQYCTHSSIFGAICAMGSPAGISLIESNVMSYSKGLPFEETLALFGINVKNHESQ